MPPSVRVALSALSLMLVSETASGMVPVSVTVPVVCAKAAAFIRTPSASRFFKLFLMSLYGPSVIVRVIVAVNEPGVKYCGSNPNFIVTVR